MVSGGVALLGTCVGFKGLFFVRRAEKSLETGAAGRGAFRRVLWLCGGQRSPWGTALWAAGARRGAFLRLLQSKADARRLTRASRRGFAHSRLGCRSKRCVCCLKRRCPPRCDSWSYICPLADETAKPPLAYRLPQASLALVADVVLDRLAA